MTRFGAGFFVCSRDRKLLLVARAIGAVIHQEVNAVKLFGADSLAKLLTRQSQIGAP